MSLSKMEILMDGRGGASWRIFLLTLRRIEAIANEC